MADWKKCVKLVVRIIIFLGIFASLLVLCSNVLKEKWHKYDYIYNIKNNSIDYLAAGMSQEYYGLNPVYIYEHTGYVGYNLGDEAQNIQFSWFWLIEALKYQSPKFFFLDVGSLFYNDYYMNEDWKRKEYSAMPFSTGKIRAILEGTDDRNTRIGSLFPLAYYHENWKKITDLDFHSVEKPYLGNNIRYDRSGSSSPVFVNPYREKHEGLQEYTSRETISETNQKYFERIVDLCYKKDIQLIPIKIPTCNWDQGRHFLISDFLTDYGLTFYDMCEENLINWNTDTIDGGYHLNYWGGCKVSDRLGVYMMELFQDSMKDDSMNSSADKVLPDDPFFHDLIDRYYHDNVDQLLSGILTGEEKREQYFRWLAENKNEYIIILTVRDHLSGDVDEIARYFRLLGLSEFEEQHRNDSYIAIIRAGKVEYESWSKKNKLIFQGNLLERNDESGMEIRSSGKASHLITDGIDLASVKISGEECALNIQGLNISIFDLKEGMLSSNSVVFNDSEWIIQGPVGRIDYMSRLLGDHSDTYHIISTNNEAVGQKDLDRIGLEQNVTIQFFYNGTYFVQDPEGRFLTVENAGTGAGTKTFWGNKTGDADQLWMLFPDENDCYYLRSLYNRLWLESNQEGLLVLDDDIDQNIILRKAAK